MVKTELSYNPYLLETIIKFNGQTPKINSLVEKYQDGKLYEWVDELPYIFRDEMNGYDFELEYSGVKADFDRVKEAFRMVGVKEEQVSFFYKNELEDASAKLCRIEKMFLWLEENRNRRFDYEQFKEDNADVFGEPYTYIIIHGNNVDTSNMPKDKYAIESVENSSELENTVITNTPILLIIDSESFSSFREDLMILLARNDIKVNQLFFYIHPTLNGVQIKRIITDLGVVNPQIVKAVDDRAIMSYFDVYPIADYIKSVLDILRSEIDVMSTILEEENAKSLLVNSSIHAKIDALENDIERLKVADDHMEQRDNLPVPEGFMQAKNVFKNYLYNWKKKKTKITKEDEAMSSAIEYDNEMKRIFGDYLASLDREMIVKKAAIDNLFEEHYVEADVDTEYRASVIGDSDNETYATPHLSPMFLALKEEKWVTPKEAFLGVLFGGGEKKEQEPVLETTYYYESWRNKAWSVYESILDRAMDKRHKLLVEYYDMVANNYHEHIIKLIEDKTKEKDRTTAQLSDDEQKLQYDNDWLMELKDILTEIERG